MKISNVAIDNRTSVFILVFIIAIMGFISYVNLPRESSPDISIPLVIVSTPYIGVSPEDIESLITQPIEKEINTITEVKEITSSSYEGYSIIRVEFESGYDIDEALQKVRDKVTKAEADLPPDVEKPEIIEINFSEFPIFTFTVSGPYGLVKLKDVAEDIEDEIENIDGVLDAKVSGGLEREVKVEVDVNKLNYYNIRFDDLTEAINSENRTIPGGSIDVNSASFLVRVPGEFDKPYIIQDLIVKIKEGKPIYVKDVADVSYSFQDRTSYSRLNENESVTVEVSKRVGANIVKIGDQIKELLENKRNELPADLKLYTSVDFSKDIKNRVKDLENNIFSGLVLVIGVLLFFMGVRNAFFVGVAIPLSMLISFMIFEYIGITLNFIVLFSLILALGMLVDNAIVIIENIYKFLEAGDSLIDAAKKGTAEVAWPITTSTLTTVVAFFPMLFWPGVVGDFMSYLPITVIVTLSASLFVALIINPVFASRFMKLEHPDDVPKTRFEKIIHPLNKITHFCNEVLLPKVLTAYESTLRYSLGPVRDPNAQTRVNKRNWLGLAATFTLIILTFMGTSTPEIPNEIVLSLAVAAGIGIILLYTNARLKVLSGTFLLLIIIMLVYKEFDHGVEFFPTTQPERIYISVEAPTGTNIEMSNKIVKNLEDKLKPFLETDVREYIANVGASTNPFDGGSSTPNKSTITVQFVDFFDRKQSSLITTELIRDAIRDVAGGEIEIQKEEAGPPVGPPVNIEISGDDFAVLGELSAKVKKLVEPIEGLVDLKDNFDQGRPELRVDIDRERAALYGMNTSLIANTIRTAINGATASKYRINEDEYDITVRLKDSQRETPDALNNMNIIYNNNEGKTLSVPLISVASIEKSKGPGAIRRTDLKRVITVSANAGEGYNQNDVLNRVKAKMENFEVPAGYKIEFTGQNEEQEKASAFLMKTFLLVLLMIFLILVIQFNSLSQPLIIMLAVVISLTGVMIGLTLWAMPFGIIMTGIGIISLAGVVVNNNIVLIDYVNKLRNKGLSRREAVVTAGLRRFRPVTLTAITTVLGLIPLTFGFGFDIYSFSFISGGVDVDFWRSMGIAVIFGLAFGTILTLVIVPVIYTTLEDIPYAIRSAKLDLKDRAARLFR